MTWVEYRFSATQPVRYLGWATSRFVHVDSTSFSDLAGLLELGEQLWQ
jgi:hypothetical protein